MKDKNIVKFQMFYFLLIGAVGCFVPYINVYLEKSIGLTGSQIGLLTAVSLILGVCVIPLWGIAGDKTRKYNLLLMFSLGASIVILYFYSKQTVYAGVLIFALLLEVARLGSGPMADTIAMNYTAKHNGNYGSIRGMGSLGYVVGSMAVGFLADIYGLDGPLFTTYMILLGLGLLLCLSFPKENEEENNEKPQEGNFKELLVNKNFIFMLVLVMMTEIVVDSSGAFAGNHLVMTLNGNNSLISWLTFVQVVPEIIYLMVSSQLIKKMGYKKFILLGSIPMAIRLFVYALVPNAVVFVGISIVHCLGVGVSTVASLAYIQESVNPAVFGTAVTLLNAAMSVAKAIYGYVFGLVYQYLGSDKIFLLSGVIVVISILMVLFTKRFDEADRKLKEE